MQMIEEKEYMCFCGWAGDEEDVAIEIPCDETGKLYYDGSISSCPDCGEPVYPFDLARFVQIKRDQQRELDNKEARL